MFFEAARLNAKHVSLAPKIRVRRAPTGVFPTISGYMAHTAARETGIIRVIRPVTVSCG